MPLHVPLPGCCSGQIQSHCPMMKPMRGIITSGTGAQESRTPTGGLIAGQKQTNYSPKPHTMLERITGYGNEYYAKVISNMAAMAAMRDVAELQRKKKARYKFSR